MALFKWGISMAEDSIFTYKNVKNNKEIGDQWRNYILKKFNDRPSWSLLTQFLGDSNTLQIDKLTPESFNTLSKIYGVPASYKDGSTDTTPVRAPLMQKSVQQTPDNNNDKTGNAVAIGGAQGAQAGNGTYDPNPGNVSLAYAMRNAPEQERRTALINKWNQEHGSTGYATGQGMLTSGSNGTYATGEGIKDANGNILTNPGGDWEYQYALRDPQYGLGMMGKMSDAQRNYLQAVADNMGFNYNFNKGATRYV